MLRVLATLAAVAALAGCALERAPRRDAIERAESLRDTTLTCARVSDRCAAPTPFAALLDGEPASNAVGLIEHGDDALALRLHLIRAARRSIDVQSFILSDDASGRLVLGELLAAARRGVKVRVLADQLFSIEDTSLLASLATAHANFQMKLYNPTFGKARTGSVEFAAGLICCWSRFNHRMHAKLVLIDGRIGITGGRNVDDRYFDLSERFNYRDRDAWLAGPATRAMQASFDAYWAHPSASPVAGLRDIRASLRPSDDSLAKRLAVDSARARTIAASADDAEYLRREFLDRAFAVESVEYFADPPNKPFARRDDARRDLSQRIAALIGSARERVTFETPYLVLSSRAREEFAKLRADHPKIRVRVATNSLAATDAFYVYAISYKYKRRYLSRLGFEIHEFKPFDPEAVAVTAEPPVARARLKRREPAPLVRAGVRRGLHAKGIVIDDAVALVGSHNFDPRSDRLNTESGLIVRDAAFARALRESIEADLAPEQAWTIARRPRRDPISRLNIGIARISENLPVFDLWPFKYATSWELQAGCAPHAPGEDGFYACYKPVGDFPEVDASLKAIYTRMVTAFGSGLEPIL